MSADDTIANVGEWAQDHKPVALGIAGATILMIGLFLFRRNHAVNGMSGATAAGVGGASLVPYGDATSMGFTGLTDLHDVNAGGFASLSEQLAGISGLLTTLQPVGSATSGGYDTGTTVPTAGGTGSSPSGQTAQPYAVPVESNLSERQSAEAGYQSILTPILQPTPAAPVTYAPPPSTTYYAPPPPPAPAPTFDFVPPPLTVGTRALSTFDAASQQKLLSGATVTGGDGRVMKYDPARGITYSTGMAK